MDAYSYGQIHSTRKQITHAYGQAGPKVKITTRRAERYFALHALTKRPTITGYSALILLYLHAFFCFMARRSKKRGNALKCNRIKT